MLLTFIVSLIFLITVLGIKAIAVHGSDPALGPGQNAGQKAVEKTWSGLKELTDPVGMTPKGHWLLVSCVMTWQVSSNGLSSVQCWTERE